MQQAERNYLAGIWRRSLQMLGLDGDSAEARKDFDTLLQRYSHSERHYHSLAHLAFMFRFLDSFKDRIERPSELALAVFFHDIIYDSRAKDNEEQSAEVAQQMLSGLGVRERVTQRIVQLILSTKQHRILMEGLDNALLLDADLSILASEEVAYRAYAAAIRREYGWVPEAKYRKGRAAVLDHFLSRERIFLLEKNHHALDSQARKNLLWERLELTDALG